MFHFSLFALLCVMFALFAFASGRADQFVIAVPAGLLALWMGDAAFRAGRRALQRRRDEATDGRR